MSADNKILKKEDLLILRAAYKLLNDYSDEFNFAARRSDDKVDMISYARTSERFHIGASGVFSALTAATHLAEQDACEGSVL